MKIKSIKSRFTSICKHCFLYFNCLHARTIYIKLSRQKQLRNSWYNIIYYHARTALYVLYAVLQSILQIFCLHLQSKNFRLSPIRTSTALYICSCRLKAKRRLTVTTTPSVIDMISTWVWQFQIRQQHQHRHYHLIIPHFLLLAGLFPLLYTMMLYNTYHVSRITYHKKNSEFGIRYDLSRYCISNQINSMV